jgi:hypothetical protein
MGKEESTEGSEELVFDVEAINDALIGADRVIEYCRLLFQRKPLPEAWSIVMASAPIPQKISPRSNSLNQLAAQDRPNNARKTPIDFKSMEVVRQEQAKVAERMQSGIRVIRNP